MYGPPGRLYVYFTMGLHFCVNVVCGPEGQASAVLLRALEPIAGLELMRARRGFDEPRDSAAAPQSSPRPSPSRGPTTARRPACGGAGSLLSRDGKRTLASCLPARAVEPRIVATPRIGVTAGADRPWRFVDADSAFLSRPLPRRMRSGLR